MLFRSIEVGVLVGFIAALNGFFDPIGQLSQVYTTYQSGMAALDKIFELLDEQPDLFSPDRVMAASNWPVILLGASYAETWSGITELVAELSADERRAVLGGTAKRIYGL